MIKQTKKKSGKELEKIILCLVPVEKNIFNQIILCRSAVNQVTMTQMNTVTINILTFAYLVKQ